MVSFAITIQNKLSKCYESKMKDEINVNRARRKQFRKEIATESMR